MPYTVNLVDTVYRGRDEINAAVNAFFRADPLTILLRGLTFLFYPLFGLGARSGWVGLYRQPVSRVNADGPYG